MLNKKLRIFRKVCVGFEGCLFIYFIDLLGIGLQLWIVAVYSDSVWHSETHFGLNYENVSPKCAILNCSNCTLSFLSFLWYLIYM